MTLTASIPAQKFGVYCGIFFLLCFSLGLAVVAPFVPPVSPALSGEEVVQIYLQNNWRIKLGCFITMMGASFQIPLFLTLFVQMARMESGLPMMAINQFALGSFNTAFFILGPVIWVTAAFRPEISPLMTQTLNDFGWILYFFIISPAILQNICIAWAILQYKGEEQILPRWFAFLNIWVALIFLPAGVVPFFKTGPFAWDGLLAFWLVIVGFSAWAICMIVLLYKAVNRQQAQSA